MDSLSQLYLFLELAKLKKKNQNVQTIKQMLDNSTKKSNYNTTSELSGANLATNAKPRMTNWQQVLHGESSLAALNVHFRASKFKLSPTAKCSPALPGTLP